MILHMISQNISQKICKKYGSLVLICLLAILALLLLIKPVIEIPYLIQKDYNEGYHAFNANWTFINKSPYPGAGGFVYNAYPPVSYYLVGGLGKVIGDNIIAGRIIAFISFIGISICIGFIVYSMIRSYKIAIFTALLFICYMATRHLGYVGMNDPHWLGIFVMMIAFALLLISNQKGPLFFLAILLVFTSGMIKHTLIALPLAMTIWLYLYNKSAFYQWIITSLVLLVLTIISLYLLYGELFFANMRNFPFIYSLTYTANKLDRWLTPLILYIAISFFLILVDRNNRYVKLVAFYVFFSAIWVLYSSGFYGLDYNHAFELVIGTIIMSALMLDWLQKYLIASKLAYSCAQIGGMLMLLLPVLLIVLKVLVNPWHLIESLKDKQVLVEKTIKFIASHPGPVMCESLAYCYWAGKENEMDVLYTGLGLERGKFSESQLIDILKGHYFKVIQLNSKEGSMFFPKSINQAIFSNYEIQDSNEATGVTLVPKSDN